MALILALQLAWADPPTGEAELADAAMEAARRIRHCEARQASGQPCRSTAEELGEASLTVAIAGLVLDGERDEGAVADTWALAPALAQRWTELLGTSEAEPSPWVGGVLDPSNIPEPQERPRNQSPVVPADSSTIEPAHLRSAHLGGGIARVGLRGTGGTRAFGGYPETFKAHLWRARLRAEAPFAHRVLLLAATGVVTRLRHKTGETLRDGMGLLELGLPLTALADGPARAGIQIRWYTGVAGWTEGTRYSEDQRLREQIGSTPPARFGLGVTSRTELATWFGPVVLRGAHRQIVLRRWSPTQHLDPRRGPALRAYRDGWVIDSRFDLELGGRLFGGWMLSGTFDAGLTYPGRASWNEQAEWKLLSPTGDVEYTGGLDLEWNQGVKRRGGKPERSTP